MTRVLEAVASDVIGLLYNDETLREHANVLLKPKFPFKRERMRKAIDMPERIGVSVDPLPTDEILPDTDGLVPYEVVMEKRCDGAHLMTSDTRHLPERSCIVAPAEMMEALDAGGAPQG